jgi:hypothetical protein
LHSVTHYVIRRAGTLILQSVTAKDPPRLAGMVRIPGQQPRPVPWTAARPLAVPDLADATGVSRGSHSQSRQARILGAEMLDDSRLLLVGVPGDNARQQVPELQTAA